MLKKILFVFFAFLSLNAFAISIPVTEGMVNSQVVKSFPNDKQYLEAVAYSENELDYVKENASVEEVEGGFKFSFPIRNSRKDFEVVSEDGRRMWLRQHLDDHFLHYAIPGMLDKSFDWDKKTVQRSVVVLKKPIRLLKNL